MVDIQSAAAEIRRGIKKEDRKIEDRKKSQGKNIMYASAMQGGHNKSKQQKPKIVSKLNQKKNTHKMLNLTNATHNAQN